MAEPNDDQGKILRWEDHIVPILEHPDIHIRDKALVAVSWESHPRPSELRRLTFGDVEDEGSFMTVNLTGPHGRDRQLVLRGSMPYLKKWLQEHPVNIRLSTDAEPLEEAAPTTPIWTQERNNESLSSAQFLAIPARVHERVGIRADVTLHNIRHSRAKLLALQLGLRTPVLRERFGWTTDELRDAVERNEDDSLNADVESSVPIQCPNCGEWKLQHQPCLWCGADS